jgi:hypothetical protein
MSATISRDEARQNHLLAEVTMEELARLLPNLQLVSLSLGQVIYESGEKMDHVFYPDDSDCFLALHNGKRLER